MSIQAQVDIRSKKLGALIREARLAARKTPQKCAHLAGVPVDVLRSWEDGLSAPSLPELELLAYALRRPLYYFWSEGEMAGDVPLAESMNLSVLNGIRQRMVGALLRQQRKTADISLRKLSEQSGISTSRIKSYEMGERPIPLPELEGLVALCGGQIMALFDQKGRVGKWMIQQDAVQGFLQMSTELQDFVSQPANRPYLELARKLSNMSADKLRFLAEDLVGKISQYDR
jgi:transcriptional regulator with XRE-family HTH domain